MLLVAFIKKIGSEGIGILAPTDLEPGDRAWLERRFLADIFPILTPLALDPAHPFPFVGNRGFGLALLLDRIIPARPFQWTPSPQGASQ